MSVAAILPLYPQLLRNMVQQFNTVAAVNRRMISASVNQKQQISTSRRAAHPPDSPGKNPAASSDIQIEASFTLHPPKSSPYRNPAYQSRPDGRHHGNSV
ncbi:hypothetical protein KCP73_02175 [Salmonella enterica subsp. enterica]|nr:hypothetical protein KCP73_02175 [Salmonella enterica subsp. enterica]